ncbi:MAG: hypothetical protein H6553_07280 [Chitinophagales bacterium]|nr:hypothetical protein [Chitinophagales bacterium]
MINPSEIGLTWTGFLLITFVIIVLMFLYHNKLSSSIFEKTNNKPLQYLVNRLILIIGIIIIMVCFVSVHILWNSIFLLIVIALFYRVIKSFVLGTWLIYELNLKEGIRFSVLNYNGVIDKILNTGIVLSNIEKKHFIHYHQLYHFITSTVNVQEPIHLEFEITLNETSDVHKIINTVKQILFDFPFLLNNNKPIIIPKENTIYISIVLINHKYIHTIYELLKSDEYQLKLKEN